MDLSKAFDSLNHELLLAKLKAYGLDDSPITFMKAFSQTEFKVTK